MKEKTFLGQKDANKVLKQSLAFIISMQQFLTLCYSVMFTQKKVVIFGQGFAMELLSDSAVEEKVLPSDRVNCHCTLMCNGWTRKLKPTIAQCENCIHYHN